jgi:antitoxin MazE
MHELIDASMSAIYTAEYQHLFLRKEGIMAIQLIKKWGNSPAVRIPAAIMEAAHLSLNQPMNVRAENGRVILEPAAPSYVLEELLAGMTEEKCHAEVNFGAPQGRELL